ncbi:hypothetical protein FNH05_22380 [Amycolatopsis rhizosphaerae]|uniref:Uncharacterized protein n=1 Tax=Amycolatopsis rhizosphaerae TaxID=2053003 RepID=A0A558C0W4_9PSEU|nr:hypothetical protein [Amycolatopsis rhizosphaerae]TVT42405.1 hypothetical protein FNH05_22380 [Amycolatopsis rhizosphaerae]
MIHFRNVTSWKFGAVAQYARGRPLAWFDDDFDLFPHQLAEFEAARKGVPTLLHTVSPSEGLREEDFDAVAEWAATLAA